MLDPMWIKKIKMSERVMDPLGMNRVSDRLVGDLLMGITALTPRARYYSFYVWVLNRCDDENIATYAHFKRRFTALERHFMMSCVAHESEYPEENHSSIIGSRKGRVQWRNSLETVEMDFPFLGKPLGGYDYYYGAPIARLGLTTHDENKGWEIPSEQGKELALEFEKSVQDTRYYQRFMEAGSIPKSVLSEYSKKACLCQLHKDVSFDRDILREIILGLNENKLNDHRHKQRQETLALVLYLIGLAQENKEILNTNKFLQASYFHQIKFIKGVTQVTFPTYFQDIIERWKIFGAHDYFSYACEALLSVFLEILDRSGGLTKEQLLKILYSKPFEDALSNIVPDLFDTSCIETVQVNEILSKFMSFAIGEKDDEVSLVMSQKFNYAIDLNSDLSEEACISMIDSHLGNNVQQLETVTASAITILLDLYIRFLHYTKINRRARAPTTSRLLGIVNVDSSQEPFLNILITRDRFLESEAFQNLRDFVRYGLDYYAIEEQKRNIQKNIAQYRIEKPTIFKVEKIFSTYEEKIPEPILFELKKDITKATEEVDTNAEKMAKQVSLIGPLASAGMATIAVQHETKWQIQTLEKILIQMEEIEREIKDQEIKDKFNELKRTFNNWMARTKSTRQLFSYFLNAENMQTRERFSAKPIIDDICSQFGALARGIPIETGKIEDMLLPKASLVEWSSIFLNIMTNAFNAMLGSKKKLVQISTRGDGKFREILIQDTGIGINLSEAESLFEPFSRKATISPEQRELGLGGSGLGLTIVRLIAFNIGCEVSFIEPEKGFKTAFSIKWREKNE